MAFQFEGRGIRTHVLLEVRAEYLACMACNHLGSAMACLTEVGSGVVRRTLGFRLPVRDLVTMGWVLVFGGGAGAGGGSAAWPWGVGSGGSNWGNVLRVVGLRWGRMWEWFGQPVVEYWKGG